jgi:hypothetical protein
VVGRIASILIVLLLAGMPPGGRAQERVTALARVDSTQYRIGDWIKVHVDLAHPKGVQWRSVVGDTINGFYVIERRPLARESDTNSSIELLFARYDSAAAVLPPLPFQYTVPGDSLARTVSTNPLLLTVRSVPVDTAKDIRDLKPPLSIPITVAELAFYAGIVLVIVTLGYLLYRWWMKRKTSVKGEEYIPPPRPAHIIALEELAALKEKKLWQKGEIKRYYSEVTEILRRYIENRYQLKALEETTDEILAGLSGIKLSGDLLRAVEKILYRADLVKFAKAQPGIHEHEEILTVVYDVVDRTKLVVMTPVPEPDAKAGVSSGN